MKSHSGFAPRSRKTLFRGRVFDLERVTIDHPDGGRMTREYIAHDGAAAIVPLLDRDHVVLVRQFRFAAGGDLWEIPAGTLEPGEAPLACARRELIEEAGYRARRLTRLACFYSAPGYCTERLFVYLAEGLEPAHAEQDPDEDCVARVFELGVALSMAERGRIVDAKTLVGLLLAERRRR